MRQSRLGDITDETARALELIQRIDARKQAGEAFWQGLVVRIVLDLDAVAAGREITRIADTLAVAMRKLEDKPAGVREVSPGLWTSGPSLVELDAYGTDPREDRPAETEVQT